MPEIKFGNSGNGSGGSSGGGSIDITDYLDQIEEAIERVENNPKLRQMLGVDIGLDDMEPDGNNSNGSGVELTAESVEEILGGMVEQGYGQYTLDQLYTYVQGNRDEVRQMIQSHARSQPTGD